MNFATELFLVSTAVIIAIVLGSQLIAGVLSSDSLKGDE